MGGMLWRNIGLIKTLNFHPMRAQRLGRFSALLLLCAVCTALSHRGIAFQGGVCMKDLHRRSKQTMPATWYCNNRNKDTISMHMPSYQPHSSLFRAAAGCSLFAFLLGVPSLETHIHSWGLPPPYAHAQVLHEDQTKAEDRSAAQSSSSSSSNKEAQEEQLIRKMRCKSGSVRTSEQGTSSSSSGASRLAASSDYCYDSLVAKLRSPNRDAPPAQPPSADGARYGGGRSMEEWKRNRRLILEAWDVIHRGGRGYPGWYDANGGFYVDPTTFLLQDRSQWVAKEENYKTKAATYDTITQMVAALRDPYSSFLTPEEARYEEGPPSPLSKVNLLVGVGLQLFDPVDGNEDLVVVAPLPESPAERAGIQPLDRLMRIDDIDVQEGRLTSDEALAALRGREGSSVDVVIRKVRNSVGAVLDSEDVLGDRLPRLVASKGADDPSDSSNAQSLWKGLSEPQITSLRLTRTPLNIPPVRAGVIDVSDRDKVGYLRVNFFNRRGTQMLSQAVRMLEEKGVSGYIIDTRNCLGGQFAEALLTATMFVPDPDAVLVSLMDANGVLRPKQVEWQVDRLRWPSTGGRPLQNAVPVTKPLTLLVNRGSASSSEVLTLALAGNRPTNIVGERTFGKALVQHPYRLADGSVIKLTVAEYLSPSLQHVSSGIYPDFLCTDSPAPEAGDSCARLAGAQIVQRANRADRGQLSSAWTTEGNAVEFVKWGEGGGEGTRGFRDGDGEWTYRWKYQGLSLESQMKELNEARRGGGTEARPWTGEDRKE